MVLAVRGYLLGLTKKAAKAVMNIKIFNSEGPNHLEGKSIISNTDIFIHFNFIKSTR